MPINDLSDIYDVGVDVLASDTNSDGTISAQTGDVVAATVSSANCEWWQHVGVASRPPRAQPGVAACQAVTLNRGDHDVCIASRDLRSQAIYGLLKEGETCIYGAGTNGTGQACALWKADGSVSLVTTDDNTASGHSMYVRLSPTNGFDVSTPWGRMTLGPLGFHVVHSGGARLDLGAIAGLPGPLSALGSYAKLEGGVASIKGGAVSLGTDGGLGNEVAVTALTALVTAINAALVTISTTPAAIGAPVLTPPQAALVTAALTTYSATAGAIGKVV